MACTDIHQVTSCQGFLSTERQFLLGPQSMKLSRTPWMAVLLSLISVALIQGQAVSPDDATGPVEYLAKLESPGGALEFRIRIDSQQQPARAWIVNGQEVLPIPEYRIDSQTGTGTFDFPHYDSSIVWARSPGQPVGHPESYLTGTWRKRTAGSDAWIEMPFTARPLYPSAGESDADGDDDDDDDKDSDGAVGSEAVDVSGRWAVDFSGDDHPAVGIFSSSGDSVQGTFLTTTGDYRYLAGTLRGRELTLSCFDGAHAFLFRATADDSGALAGDFWSGTRWHEQWTAVRDDQAALPDPLGLTTWDETVRLEDLKFPDIDGQMHSLDEEQFAGRARVLHLFGTWCPNCDDAGKFMAELHQQYASEGLAVTGLAFELTDDAGRNGRQVRRYIDRHSKKYPVLVAGLADKAAATVAFRGLDRVRSFPTTVFMDRQGTVRAIYTGFSGPATGAEHERLKATFHRIIREILDEEEGAGR